MWNPLKKNRETPPEIKILESNLEAGVQYADEISSGIRGIQYAAIQQEKLKGYYRGLVHITADETEIPQLLDRLCSFLGKEHTRLLENAAGILLEHEYHLAQTTTGELMELNPLGEHPLFDLENIYSRNIDDIIASFQGNEQLTREEYRDYWRAMAMTIEMYGLIGDQIEGPGFHQAQQEFILELVEHHPAMEALQIATTVTGPGSQAYQGMQYVQRIFDNSQLFSVADIDHAYAINVIKGDSTIKKNQGVSSLILGSENIPAVAFTSVTGQDTLVTLDPDKKEPVVWAPIPRRQKKFDELYDYMNKPTIIYAQNPMVKQYTLGLLGFLSPIRGLEPPEDIFQLGPLPEKLRKYHRLILE